MRAITLIAVFLLVLPSVSLADQQTLRTEFRLRLEAALNHSTAEDRRAALKNLFYQEDLDERGRALLDRLNADSLIRKLSRQGLTPE